MADSSHPKAPKLRRFHPVLPPSRFARWRKLPGRALSLWRRKGLTRVFVRFGEMLVNLAKRRKTVKNELDPNVVYRDWLKENERNNVVSEPAPFELRPLISFITPVFNPPPEVFRAMLESVRAQTYDHWEICLANGDPSNTAIRSVCEEFTTKDARIHVTYLERNFGIAGNSNCSLQMAQGDYVCLMDHDDVIPRYALAEIVQRLNKKPETDLVYFDEDLISADGQQRMLPIFKPDWSPEMLLSVNYLSHAVVRRSLVEKVGRFDTSMDGAQDWDLFLRCVEETDRIEHIPKFLYHWRQVPGSCAGVGTESKPYARENQLRAVKNHLERRGIADPTTYFYRNDIVRSVWPVSGKKVSIIIPTKDKVHLLKQCVESILAKTEYPSYEIIIVDNASREAETLAYYDALRDRSNVRIVSYPLPFNYSAANNFGVRYATGDLLLFLNNDTEAMHFDWLEELARWAEMPNIGAVGTKLLYREFRIQHAGVVVGMQGHASHVYHMAPFDHSDWFGSVDWYRNYLAVTGACVMMRRNVFEEIGGFDEKYDLVFSDVEICVRAVQHGYRVMYTPFAETYHYEGKSRAQSMPLGDCERAVEQLYEWVKAGDPYFNPNLSFAERLPTLAQADEETRLDRLDRVMNEMRKIHADAA